MRLAVIGAGNGGSATAAHLSLLGHEVSLFELPQFEKNIRQIRRQGGLRARGAIEGFARLKEVSTSIESVIHGASIIFVVVPAFGQKAMATHIAPFLENGQTIFLTPGSTGGALEFRHTLDQIGITKEVRIAETNSLPYACRLTGPAEVRVFLVVKRILCAAFPGKETSEFVKLIKAVHNLPIWPMTDVLETGLNNDNPVIHPAATLLNAGRIEYSKGDFYLYKEGISPSVTRLIEAVDMERLSLCKKLGYEAKPDPDLNYEAGYSPKRTYEDCYTAGKIFPAVKGPTSLNTRYITEDVGYGLVTWASLGEMIGVETPAITTVIRLASILNGVDYFQQQKRSMRSLGISDMKIAQLRAFLYEGNGARAKESLK
jgi:opine dehydrogenase